MSASQVTRRGSSVTQRARHVKQPRGGYLNPKTFISTPLGEGIETLSPEENVAANIIGSTVDYTTRLATGTPRDDAFKIPLMGAAQLKLIAEDTAAFGPLGFEADNALETALALVDGITGLDDTSLNKAIKLTGFETVYRAGLRAYKPIEDINPDKSTISNLRTMVERSMNFLNIYGPKTLDGFTFEGGYTDTVSYGDGDFTTPDTLWDFKVSKLPIKKEHTLHLLMYWRMGLHSVHPEFQSIRYLGIFNPRTNTASRLSVDSISVGIIEEVEKDVIGYLG